MYENCHNIRMAMFLQLPRIDNNQTQYPQEGHLLRFKYGI